MFIKPTYAVWVIYINAKNCLIIPAHISLHKKITQMIECFVIHTYYYSLLRTCN